SKLSLAAKIVATAILTFQSQYIYADETWSDTCGDDCTLSITADKKLPEPEIFTRTIHTTYDGFYPISQDKLSEEIEVIRYSLIDEEAEPKYVSFINKGEISTEKSGKKSGANIVFSRVIPYKVDIKNLGENALISTTGNAIFIEGVNYPGSVNIVNEGVIASTSVGAIYIRAYPATIHNKGTIDAGYGAAIITTSDTNITSLGGKIRGTILIDSGNDTVTLENTDVSELWIIRSSVFYPEDDDFLRYEDEKNILNLNQRISGRSYIQDVILAEPLQGKVKKNDTRIYDFDEINIGNKGHLILTGNLSRRDLIDFNAFKNPDGTSIFNDTAQTNLRNYEIGSAVSNEGILSFSPELSSANIKYRKLDNNGIIDLTEGSRDPAQTLTLYGDYVGGENSKLRVDSKWNNPDVQENDQLIIKGKASGTTKVEVKDVIAGDVIRSSVEKNGGWSKPVVIVEQGDEGKVVFTGTANTQGAEEAQLARRENGSATEYTWVLNAQVAPVMPQPATPVVPQPNQPVQPTPVVPQSNSAMPQTTAPSIYAKTVSGYVQTNFINREIGLAQLGRLHERVGEQQLQNAGKSERSLNSWGRTRFTEGTLQGKNRFGVDSHQGLVQVGQDVAIKEFASGYAHQGLMFSHSWANNQFYDKYRAENGVITAEKGVGKGKTKAFSLGAYHTYYANDNSYLDFVANLSWLENKYMSQQTARQTGLGVGASVEIGRSYALNPQWRIEPQAQLKAQYLTLGSVNDGVRKVKADDSLSVQGRLGARVTNGQFYVSANLVQDLTPAKATVKIGQSSVTERYNATQFDVALGANVTLNKAQTLALYGEAKYSRALGGSNKVFSHRNGRENYTAQVGVRFQW
ncbi:autotransporter family protein, partial [Ursidibacter sp. B-7004-1]